MGRIIQIHSCKRVPLVIILGEHVTISGTTMWYVTFIKSNGEQHQRVPFNMLENAQAFFDREAAVDA